MFVVLWFLCFQTKAKKKYIHLKNELCSGKIHRLMMENLVHKTKPII